MKKKLIIAATVVIFLVVSVVGFFILGSGIKPNVSSSDIETKILYNKITNTANERYEKKVGITPENSEELPTDKKVVKKELKLSFVAVELCKEKKIELSKEDARQISDAEYDSLKNYNQRYYNILAQVLEEFKVSEEKYRDIIALEAYYKYNGYTLRKDFEHSEFDNNSKKDFDTQYKNYLKDKMAFGIFG